MLFDDVNNDTGIEINSFHSQEFLASSIWISISSAEQLLRLANSGLHEKFQKPFRISRLFFAAIALFDQSNDCPHCLRYAQWFKQPHISVDINFGFNCLQHNINTSSRL